MLLADGFNALKAGSFDAARKLYREAVALAPESKEARTGLEKASSLYLANIRYTQNIASAAKYLKGGRYPLAAKFFNDAMTSRPSSVPPSKMREESRIRTELALQSQQIGLHVVSDKKTYVSMIGVFAPERFKERDLKLYPDVYKLKGTRKGYRSIEIEIKVDTRSAKEIEGDLHRETMSRRLLIFTQSCFAWVGGLMICVGATYAAVDPDLFDGRMTPPPPVESSEASGSEGASGDIEQSAGEGAGEASSESRDFSEIASVTAGDTVGGESSKSGASSESPGGSRDFGDVGQVGGGESVDSASSKSGATTRAAGGGCTAMRCRGGRRATRRERWHWRFRWRRRTD